MRKLIVSIGAVSLFLVTAHASFAAKPAKIAPAAIKVSTAVSRDKKSVSVYFSNLQKTSSIFYTLSYTGNGVAQGAGGQIKTGKSYSLSRKLLFGTCSAGVCRYHRNIKKAKLTVTVTFKNGTKKTYTYTIRV